MRISSRTLSTSPLFGNPIHLLSHSSPSLDCQVQDIYSPRSRSSGHREYSLTQHRRAKEKTAHNIEKINDGGLLAEVLKLPILGSCFANDERWSVFECLILIHVARRKEIREILISSKSSILSFTVHLSCWNSIIQSILAQLLITFKKLR